MRLIDATPTYNPSHIETNSEITFGELCGFLPYIMVVWNNKVVYDDMEGNESILSTARFEKKFEHKIVYKMTAEIVAFHHCILYIEGEEL